MAEPMSLREVVALALHNFYCLNDETGEPCLGQAADVEGWTPVARDIVAILRDQGLAIHREADCIRIPKVEGRPMTPDEEVAAGLRVPAPGRVDGLKVDSVVLDEAQAGAFDDLKREVQAVNPDEFVFGDS